MNDFPIERAINTLRPNSEFVIFDNDYNRIEWISISDTPPTESEIKTEIEKLKIKDLQEAEAKEAARQALLDKLGITADEAKLLLS